MRASLQFRVTPKKYFLLSVRRRELYKPGSRFFLFDRHEYTHGITRSVILISIFTLRVY